MAASYISTMLQIHPTLVMYRLAQQVLVLWFNADVSNAANGGQVLMCETTFHAVKEELWRLGLVTASGLNYDLLYSGSSSSSKGGSRSGSGSSRTGSVTSRSRLLGCVSGRR